MRLCMEIPQVLGADRARRSDVAPDPGLAELVFEAALDDLSRGKASAELSRFVKDVFAKEGSPWSERVRQNLANALVAWTLRQSREVRTSVWLAFHACGCAGCLVEMARRLGEEECKVLLDVQPIVRSVVLDPWFPGRKARRERQDATVAEKTT